MSKIDDKTLNKIIKETLGLEDDDKKVQTIAEAFVVQAQKYDINTDLLSQKAIEAHLRLLDGYIEVLNEISAKLDSVDRSPANSSDSNLRRLKIDETYNLNAAFLHAYYFDAIGDVASKITMDSLTYMRLARDFGTFDDWQKDFIATALSARSGWAVTVYNCYLNRYMNVVIDLHSTNVPMNCYPVIVLDMWEHAYWRDYLGDKQKYIFAMMKEFNWDIIEKRFKRGEKLSRIFTKPLGAEQ